MSHGAMANIVLMWRGKKRVKRKFGVLRFFYNLTEENHYKDSASKLDGYKMQRKTLIWDKTLLKNYKNRKDKN